MNLKEQLGKNIQKYRKLNKITQEQLAEQIDVEINSISALERGINFPSTNTLEKLAKTLNVTLADLFTFSENETCADYENEIQHNLSLIKNDKPKLQAVSAFIKHII